MAENPFAKYAQPAGDPVIARDPYKAEDQQMQRDAAARAARDQELQERRFQITQAREAERDARQAVQDARQLQKDQQGSVEQGKAAGFLLRALQANDAYEAQEIDARTGLGQALANNAPTVLNSLPESIGNSPRRQVADASQNEFIAATLRYESGAAIPPEELEAQRRRYFPMPGDGPDALKAKAQLRATALEALKQSSGPLADQTIAKFAGMDKTPQAGEAKDLLESLGITGTITDEAPAAPAGDTDPSPPSDGPPDDRNAAGLAGLGSLVKQGATFGLNDEAAGVGGFLSDALLGRDPVEGYRRERDIERRFVERSRGEWGGIGTGVEFLGGGAAARLASIPNALGAIVRQGAGLGAIGGFGYGEGLEDSAAGAVVGAGAGAALGAGLYGAGRGVNALAQRRANAPRPNAEVLAAGERQNIPIRQADARPEVRGRYGQVEATERGGPLIRQAIADDATAIEGRIAEIGGQGTVSDPYALGTRVQEAGGRYVARTRQQADRLYTRARDEAGGATVTATNADAALDRNIQELRAAGENSNAAAINYLQGLRDDINRGLSVESIQNIRANMRGQINERNLTGTDTERRVGQVIAAMTQDLTEQLPQSASQALRAADDFYRQRQEFINGTLKQFVARDGSISAETASQRLISMAQGKGNQQRFANMWQQLDSSEQADVAATIASSLGRRANGEFSVATLVNSLDPRKGINPRTARLIFGEEGAQALRDLRVIAQAKTEAGSQRNYSASGKVMQRAAGGLKNLILAGLGFGAGDVTGAIAAPIAGKLISNWGEQRAARMLLNPDFTRWLRNAPNTTNPRVIDRYFGRLAGIGSISANDNQAFTQALMEAVRQSPRRAAAEEENDAGQKPPQQ